MKIERRRVIVSLNQGQYEQQLADLQDQALAAEQVESMGQKRHGTKSRAAALAVAHDALVVEAEAASVKVTVWAISQTAHERLADAHPPREDDAEDKRNGVNMATFPGVLLREALVAPEGEPKGEGDELVTQLGELSRLHYVKLERAAWNVNIGDDALPKFSLVSLLKQQRDPDSKRPNDSE